MDDLNHKHETPQDGLLQLRQRWREARADDSADLDLDEVFDELERKYQAIADANETVT